MITLQDVTKTFGDFHALHNVTLTIPEGSLTALLGPSGSGKSTLLRVIAGLEAPDSGRVIIDGADATALPVQRRGIGFVFQHYAAFKHLTVRENIAFGLRIRKHPKAEITTKVNELLDIVGLQGHQNRYPNQLSGGQRQRMALARALAIQPRVLLLDEPFGALDANVRADLRARLRRLHDDVHVTTILVTHDQQEAMDVADTITILNHGHIEQTGTPRELYDHPTNPFVMTFLGPIARIDHTLVRPHDLHLTTEPRHGAHEAMINRVIHLGFEVRAELQLHDGTPLTVQLTRDDATALELNPGDIVWVGQSAASEAVAA
jgi:sulfate/thiosulfate transport system ATP-binding protein